MVHVGFVIRLALIASQQNATRHRTRALTGTGKPRNLKKKTDIYAYVPHGVFNLNRAVDAQCVV